MEEKRNNRQSDSSANQSDSTKDISSNNDNKTTNDNSGDDACSDSEDETTDDNSGDDTCSNNEDEATDDNSGDDTCSNNEDEATDDNSGDDTCSNNEDEATDDNSGDDTCSNNEDEATDDNSGDDACSNNEDKPVDIKFDSKDIKKTLQSKLSIFKLANNRLDGFENIQDDMKKFGKCITKTLEEKGMEYKGDNGDKCQPYHLVHFFYCTTKEKNMTAVQIKKQLAYTGEIEDCPGNRRTGNILVFYRLKDNVPEAFFLCQGFAYYCILYLSDPSFRTRVVKRFMDGEKIKEIETLNIAGSDVTSKSTYKGNCNIAAVSFLERAIASLSGIIVKNSELDKLIQQDGSKEILMEVGLNFVRICKPLTLEEWTKVLVLFSDEVGDEVTEVNRPTCHIRDALDYVRRVEAAMTSCELKKTITKQAIDIIANNKPTSNYYLSHRYIRDWSLSSNIILSEKKNNKKKEIISWNSAPTLIMVIEAINRHFETPSLIEERLKCSNIVLSYVGESGMKTHPVQDFVHGSVSQDGGQYFKIAQKWFFLSSTYSQVVDRNFAYMSQCMLVDKRISELMKYPWRPHKLEITKSAIRKSLGVSSDEAKKIVQMLKQKCKLVDEDNHCCLTKHSYLLPQSSDLYKELAKKVKGIKVGKMLYQVLTAKGKEMNDTGILSVLQKERTIIVKEAGIYSVCNPILTKDMMEQIKSNVPSLEESRLSKFLRCMMPLSEGDYNALYLNCDENEHFIILPGDKVFANNVELFDILVYDKKNHTTYLFHNKVGLDYVTRDACAQIRNSSELLWYDFVRGQRNHIELFWESAVNPEKAETPYRYFLRRKLKKLGHETFMNMFDDNAKIVFVLGFVISQSKASPKLQWKFKQLTLNDFQENDLKEDDKIWLETEGILTESRYLNDCFIGMTQDKFVGKFKSKDMKTTRLKKIHTFLLSKATCKLSTIAKLELLTLNNCFSRYQIGGERHYHLKLLQLDSK